MFESSPSTEKLDEALAKAQSEFKSAFKDSQNPHFQSEFASLTSVIESARPALTKHGLSVTQWPIASNDGRIHLMTRVAFKGEWMRSTFSIPAQKNDPQGFGSSLTYIKRYSYAATLGIIDQLDDDAEAAMDRSKIGSNYTTNTLKYHQLPSKENSNNNAKVTEGWLKVLRKIAESKSLDEFQVTEFAKIKYGVTGLENLTQNQCKDLQEFIRNNEFENSNEEHEKEKELPF